ncbi:MAG TPA: ABC transporter permease [Chloroflexota bacterium]|nr:ABC transporter permease [Chloroflexota bacterium]
MTTYVIRRLLQSFIILIGLSLVFFLILHLTPGGPCNAEEAQSAQSAAMAKACVFRLGLNQPLPVQYFKWIGGYLHGDFGMSYLGIPVSSLILQKLPATVLLMLTSYLLQQLIALPLGMFSALRQYSFFDHVFTFLSYVGLSMPTFWLGLMLIYGFAVNLNWFPTAGVQSATMPIFWTGSWFHLLGHDPALVLGDLAKHLILPAITLMVIGIAVDSRFMRASMLEVLHQDYIRTAKAKGLKTRRIILKHALRNAILPIVTNVALFLPALIGGAIITETIFSWAGLGYAFFTAIQQSDYPYLQSFLMLTALAVLLANLLSDLAYAWVDPRIRYD